MIKGYLNAKKRNDNKWFKASKGSKKAMVGLCNESKSNETGSDDEERTNLYALVKGDHSEDVDEDLKDITSGHLTCIKEYIALNLLKCV